MTPHPHDFTRDRVAVANRRRKAEVLARAAVWLGSTDLQDLDDPDTRAGVLAHARNLDPSIRSASEETWAVTRAVRAETRVHRLPPGSAGDEAAARVRCGCTPHPVTRVLFEALIHDPVTEAAIGGWPCPHADPYTDAPPPPALNDAGGVSSTGWGDVGLDDGSEPDWQALLAQAALNVLGKRPGPHYVDFGA